MSDGNRIFDETLAYKDFVGSVEFEDGTYHGRVAGIKDVVTYESDRRDELEAAFRESVDDYLSMLRAHGG